MENMKKEKNVATEEEVTVADAVAEEIVGESVLDLKLFVERRLAKDKLGKPIKTKSGEPIYNYVLPIELRGRKTVVDFAPADKGGFEPLDLVFDGKKTAELLIVPYEMDKNGKKQSGIRYEVQNIDSDGIVWKCGVKPARKSDVDLINMYINVLVHKAVG